MQPDIRPSHAHVMLAMREVTRDGASPADFGAKVQDWNGIDLLTN